MVKETMRISGELAVSLLHAAQERAHSKTRARAVGEYEIGYPDMSAQNIAIEWAAVLGYEFEMWDRTEDR